MVKMDMKQEDYNNIEQEVSHNKNERQRQQSNNEKSSVQSSFPSSNQVNRSISTPSQPATLVKPCTKVKKEEEGGEIKLEWNGDECDCEECRVERQIKIEFNQTIERVHLPGPSNANKGASELCKRVKKDEDETKGDSTQTHQCNNRE